MKITVTYEVSGATKEQEQELREVRDRLLGPLATGTCQANYQLDAEGQDLRLTLIESEIAASHAHMNRGAATAKDAPELSDVSEKQVPCQQTVDRSGGSRGLFFCGIYHCTDEILDQDTTAIRILKAENEAIEKTFAEL